MTLTLTLTLTVVLDPCTSRTAYAGAAFSGTASTSAWTTGSGCEESLSPTGNILSIIDITQRSVMLRCASRVWVSPAIEGALFQLAAKKKAACTHTAFGGLPQRGVSYFNNFLITKSPVSFTSLETKYACSAVGISL